MPTSELAARARRSSRRSPSPGRSAAKLAAGTRSGPQGGAPRGVARRRRGCGTAHHGRCRGGRSGWSGSCPLGVVGRQRIAPAARSRRATKASRGACPRTRACDPRAWSGLDPDLGMPGVAMLSLRSGGGMIGLTTGSAVGSRMASTIAALQGRAPDGSLDPGDAVRSPTACAEPGGRRPLHSPS